MQFAHFYPSSCRSEAAAAVVVRGGKNDPTFWLQFYGGEMGVDIYPDDMKASQFHGWFEINEF